jgi:hypothetical protein
MSDAIAELAARVAALEAAFERARGRRDGELRADHAQHMNAATWAAIYGAPIPGRSRSVAEVAAERQLAARGRVWGARGGGSEVVYGELAGWR